MSKITENIESALDLFASHRLIRLVRGKQIEMISFSQAKQLAQRHKGEFYLVIRKKHVRQMVEIEVAPRPWQPCYRTLEAAAFPPFPGFFERQQTAGEL